jgi:hypothetical protein
MEGQRAQLYFENTVALLTAKVFRSVLGHTKSFVDVPYTPSVLRIWLHKKGEFVHVDSIITKIRYVYILCKADIFDCTPDHIWSYIWAVSEKQPYERTKVIERKIYHARRNF